MNNKTTLATQPCWWSPTCLLPSCVFLLTPTMNAVVTQAEAYAAFADNAASAEQESMVLAQLGGLNNARE